MGARKAWVILAVGLLLFALNLEAQQARPKYTIEEYNDYTAAVNEQDAQARLRAMDAFLQKYPHSALRPFVLQDYLQIYYRAQNWAKVVESADRFLALEPAVVEETYKQPGQSEEQLRQQLAVVYYQTLYARTEGFSRSFQDKGPQADAEAEKAVQMAQRGLEQLEKLSKPDTLTPEKWAEVKKQAAAQFRTVLAAMAFRKKDFDRAAREYRLLAEQFPNDAIYAYRLSLSLLQSIKPRLDLGMTTEEVTKLWGRPNRVSQTQLEGLIIQQWCYGRMCERAVYFDNERLKAVQSRVEPPDQQRYLQGLWFLARGIALFPENQKKSMRDFLIAKLAAYQGFAEACPSRHVEAQADELIGKAKAAATPPPGWTLPSAEQVAAVRGELPVKRIFDDLKAGGEQRNLIWVASCGLELPELSGEVVEVLQSPDNLITLRLAVGEEAGDTRTPTVELKVKEPPEAKNLKPADIVRFTGILADYQAEPFLLKLTEGRINPEDIPKGESPAPRRRQRPASR